LSTLIMAAMIVCLMAMYYVAHRIAHAIVTEYGLLGGFITCGAMYAIGLIMDRRGM
jgi:sterol desaturase/sphingolipid hydroxylase (fatty acid hydroxylase superfamily)